MTDAALISTFEAGILPPADFHHREHVRLAWLYLQLYGRAETERRLLQGLRALALRAGKPDKFDEPLTRAWVRRIDEAAASASAAPSSEAFIARHPELLAPLPAAPLP
jgi:hypothetical protein